MAAAVSCWSLLVEAAISKTVAGLRPYLPRAGVGFGSVMSKSKTVTDEMFLAAARALADVVTPEQIDRGQLYPEPKDLRKVAATVRVLLTAPLHVPITLTPRSSTASGSKMAGPDRAHL